jgi:flagellar biosynthesis component FlhA
MNLLFCLARPFLVSLSLSLFCISSKLQNQPAKREKKKKKKKNKKKKKKKKKEEEEKGIP